MILSIAHTEHNIQNTLPALFPDLLWEEVNFGRGNGVRTQSSKPAAGVALAMLLSGRSCYKAAKLL